MTVTSHISKNKGSYGSGVLLTAAVSLYFLLPTEMRPVLAGEYDEDRQCEHINDLRIDLRLSKVDLELARIESDKDDEKDAEAEIAGYRSQIALAENEHPEC